MCLTKIYKTLILSLLSGAALAQGTIGNEEITITKDRQITLPKANRVFEKIPVIESEKASKKITYTFFERKPSGLQAVNFQPSVIDPLLGVSSQTLPPVFSNYLKLGGGNLGRAYGELHYNSDQASALAFGVHLLHNSTQRGPVDTKNSSLSTNMAELNGRYALSNVSIKAGAGYQRRMYHFYGYDTTRMTIPRNEIRQLLNMVNFSLGVENNKPNTGLDYKINSEVKTLRDAFEAQEIDWGTHLNLHFPLLQDQLVASLSGEASIMQRTDNQWENQGVNLRRLFKIEPLFTYTANQVSFKIGYRAVNQYDPLNQINRINGFPVAEITYKNPAMYYFTLGMDGDIMKNTLRSLLDENPFLRNQFPLLNSEKPREIFLSSKGDITRKLTYQAKFGVGKFRNLHFFKIYDQYLSPAAPTRIFDVAYEKESTNFFHGNIQLHLEPLDNLKTSVNASYYHYQLKNLAKPFHRPALDVKFNTSYTIANRFVASADVFVMSGLYGNDPFTSQEYVKLPSIIDLNAQFNYLLSRQFTAFVRLNNILGKNYQRFAFYPQQGLNFLVGMDVSL